MSVVEKPTTEQAYALPRDTGVIDLWWPFNPAGVVGRYSMKTTAEQTQGRLSQVLITDGRGAAAPLHIHHDADESFYVIDGQITLYVGEERIEAAAGFFVLVPKGVPHAFLVQSEQAEFLISFAPAGTEGFLAEVGIPVVPGEPKPRPMAPDPEAFARRSEAYASPIVGPAPTLD